MCDSIYTKARKEYVELGMASEIRLDIKYNPGRKG